MSHLLPSYLQAEERVANLNARDVDMIAWSLAKVELDGIGVYSGNALICKSFGFDVTMLWAPNTVANQSL